MGTRAQRRRAKAFFQQQREARTATRTRTCTCSLPLLLSLRVGETFLQCVARLDSEAVLVRLSGGGKVAEAEMRSTQPTITLTPLWRELYTALRVLECARSITLRYERRRAIREEHVVRRVVCNGLHNKIRPSTKAHHSKLWIQNFTKDAAVADAPGYCAKRSRRQHGEPRKESTATRARVPPYNALLRHRNLLQTRLRYREPSQPARDLLTSCIKLLTRGDTWYLG